MTATEEDDRNMVKCLTCLGTGDSTPVDSPVKVVCDRCEGTGSVDSATLKEEWEKTQVSPEEEEFDDGDELICPMCNGLGEDPRTDKICTACHGQGWKTKGGEEDE